MLEIKGKYSNAKVFTNLVESQALDQVRDICDLFFMKDCSVRIMPDVHPGAGCVVGATLEIKNEKVVPSMVGVDIGCGMYTINIGKTSLDFAKLDSVIKNNIPAGYNTRKELHPFVANLEIENLKCIKSINLERAFLSLGTLGGGNHFIELSIDSQENIYLIVHSGSRYLGLQVANYYENEAQARLNHANHKEAIEELVREYKSKGKESEIETAIKNLKSEYKKEKTPKHFAYCEGDLFFDYLHDMRISQEYASWNRRAIANEIIKGMGWDIKQEFETIHNYIDISGVDNIMMLRKGAVSAREGEKLVIPINMRDGSLLCIGRGNKDWNYSAPHGAGRLMSRSKVKEAYTMDDYKEAMEKSGVFSTSINRSTLDECPMAYKPIESIINNIGETVDVVDILTPLYNFKAGE